MELIKKFKIFNIYKKNYFILIAVITSFITTSLPVKADIAPPPLTTFNLYINKKGHIVFPTKQQKKAIEYISTQKYKLGEYNEGLALKQENGKWGFVDINNNWVIEPKFPGINCFYSDISGNIHRNIYCLGFTAFSEGLASIKYEAKPMVRLRDKDNKLRKYEVVFDTEIENSKYNNEVYGTIENNKFHIKLLTKLIPSGSNLYCEEPYTLERQEQIKKLKKADFFYEYKTGYIDKQGNIVFDVSDYQDTYPFSDGMAAVAKFHRGKYGFIDKTGKLVIKPKYRFVSNFNNGIARVQIYTSYVLFPFSIILLVLIILVSITIKRDLKNLIKKEETDMVYESSDDNKETTNQE